MADHELDSGDHAMFWFNLVGITLAAVLIGWFFWTAGPALLLLLLDPPNGWPDR